MSKSAGRAGYLHLAIPGGNATSPESSLARTKGARAGGRVDARAAISLPFLNTLERVP